MDYTNLIYIGVAVPTGLYLFKRTLEHREKMAVQQAKVTRLAQPTGLGLTQALMNAEKIRAELYKLRDDQLQAGVKPEQMAALTTNIKLAEFAVSNKAWLQYVVPTIDDLGSSAVVAAKRLMRYV